MFKYIFSKLLKRQPDSNKYDFGHVLIIGGSPGMVGAPLLAGRAALRSGAGLVTIASKVKVTSKLDRRVEEIMTLTLPNKAPEATAKLLEFIGNRKVSAVVFGPGLKNDAYGAYILKRLLVRQDNPVIIDAGGLGVLSTEVEILKISRTRAVILTPHNGEFQRLVEERLPSERVKSRPIVINFSKDNRVILVLKGQPTYVTRPEGHIYENHTGNPGLATAGSGDVLTGVIAGLISQKIKPSEAAESAVYLHGLAGDIAASLKTEPGMIASDIIESLPAALKQSGS